MRTELFAGCSSSVAAVAGAGEAVDLQAEYARSAVQAILDELERDLVGMQPVKTAIREIAAFLLIDRTRRKLGMTSEAPGLHMSFTGKPGTGKTTVALRMASILHRLGYIQKGHMIAASRTDLTGGRTGQVIDKAVGGVLFIDEAYYLHQAAGERDQTSEVIETLLQAMENRRGEFVVIVAGYKDRMARFFDANPGLASRIDNHVAFPDYTDEELFAIGALMLARQQYRLGAAAEEAFRRYIERCTRLTYFANARSIRNAIDEFRKRQANRLFARMGEPLAVVDLMTIEAADILASRIFKAYL
ncbi:AAA family ATPase [Gloeobacter morelensis]|uniref:AAA family ATPase n=1 Tax=Gloeobacter morelensis MG652769 TaxID=2781736 RepID=A0ABY3PG17_9CYAN|nr:AAA family ATPase [Gloeobacter morelensis]UFP92596.1 AAA family ATPase [Gloeobacter morelensis MG652769]